MAFSLKAVFGMDTTGVRTELKQLRREVNNAAEGFAKIGLAAAGAAFVKFGKDAIESASAIKNVSDNLGIGVEAFQALQIAAQDNGVAQQQFIAVLTKLKGSTEDAAAGNKGLATAFAQLGINARELAKIPLDRQMEEVARGFAKARDEGQAYNAVTQIFGEKVGPKMLTSLRELSEKGLAGVAAQAKETGRVMSEDTVVALEKAGTEIEKWKTKMTVAIGNILVNFRTEEGLKALGFGLLEVAARFGGKVMDMISEANDFIGAAFKGTFTGVVNLFRDGLINAVISIAEQVNKILPDNFEINVGNLEQLKSSGEYVADSINKAIAETEPSKFSETWGDYWKTMKDEAQLAADVLNTGGMSAADHIKEGAAEASKALALANPINLATRKEELEYILLARKALSGMSEEESARFAQLKLISKEREIQQQMDVIMAKGAANITREEQEQLFTLSKQKDKLGEQISEKQRLVDKAKEYKQVTEDTHDALESNKRKIDEMVRSTEAMARATGAMVLALNGAMYGSDQLAEASDDALKAIINRAREAERKAYANALNNPNALVTPETDSAVLQARNTARAAEAELAQRRTIQGLEASGGLGRLYGDPRYNPLQVDAMINRYATGTATIDQTLRTIATGLQANNIIPKTINFS